jgi:hypothetical protein
VEVIGDAMTNTGNDLRAQETPPSGSEPHGADAAHGDGEPHDEAEPHGIADHAMDPGHEHDDHGHMDVPLAPVDWAQWGAGAFGVALGLIMWFCFAFATS